MATWIVHLRLAENLLQRIEGLDPAWFAMGNVAPDSGIPDEEWDSFTPPPEVSHYLLPRVEDQPLRDSADLRFYRDYLASVDAAADPLRFSFLLGYFFHLVTDNLWTHQIGLPTHARFGRELEADPKFIWQIKRDWYGLDFAHVRSHPQSLFWTVFLGCAYTEDMLDLMPPEAVQQRIDYIRTLYQRTDEEAESWYVRRPGLYLSREEMDRFVEGATAYLLQTYEWTSEEGADTAAAETVLQLLDPDS